MMLEDHYPLPVNELGDGPADGDDFHHFACACGASAPCTNEETVMMRSSDGRVLPVPVENR